MATTKNKKAVKKPVKKETKTKKTTTKKTTTTKKSEVVAMNTPESTPAKVEAVPVSTVNQVKVSSESLNEIQSINESINQLKLELGNLVVNARVTENNFLNKIQEAQTALQGKVKEVAVKNNVDLENQRWNFDLVTGVFTKK